MSNTVTIKAKVQRKIFHNEETSFGIFAIYKPDNVELVKNSYGNISVQGHVKPLAEGEYYEFILNATPKDHARYGTYYEIERMVEEDISDPQIQEKFLREIITRQQVDTLRELYPDENLIELILNDQIDLSKTKGIKEHSFSLIKKKVQANLELMELIAYLADLGVSINKIHKITAHFNDSASYALDVIKENIYALCKIKGFGFKTIDDIALSRGDDHKSSFRIHAGVSYLLTQNAGEGHTWMPEDELLQSASELMELTSGTILPEIEHLESKGVVYREIKNNLIALSYHIKTEKQILHHLMRIQDNYEPTTSTEDVAYGIANIEEVTGLTFTEEQRHAIVDGNKHGVMIVNGVAGSGKTQTVKGLVESTGDLSYMTATLSGKASSVLALRGIQSSTIHRMLGFTNGGFEYNETNPLPYSVIVLDEMSMIDAGLVLSVLKAVPSGAKLILVGDSGQLPAIGYGDVLRDLLATSMFPKYELTKVHRQAQKSGILSLANEVRKGEQISGWESEIHETFGELKDQTVITYKYKDQIVDDILKICTQYKQNNPNREANAEFQVIVPNRERGNLSTKHMNNLLQPIFNPKAKEEGLKWNGYEYKTHDKIMTKGNSYGILKYEDMEDYNYKVHMGYRDKKSMDDNGISYTTVNVFNGSVGFIERIDKNNKQVILSIEGMDGLIALGQGELDKIEMAYASTTHRQQGSSSPNVLFAVDYGAYKLLSRQLVYTALTRASKRGVLLAENNALYSAIQNDASDFRRTRLQFFIDQELMNPSKKGVKADW